MRCLIVVISSAMAQLLVASWLLLLLCPALVSSSSRVPMALPTSSTTPIPGGAAPPTATLPGCPSMCGNVSIPYPFGIGKECSRTTSFSINCSHSYNPPRPYLGDFEVIDINVTAGEMRVFSSNIGYSCYKSSTNISSRHFHSYRFPEKSMLISASRNEFTGVGCHNLAVLRGNGTDDDGGYMGGCITTCASIDDAPENGSACAGSGCCQTAMPSGLNLVKVGWSIGDATPVNRAWKYSSCNYGFVAEKGWYKFNRTHLNGTGQMSLNKQWGDRTVPLVLDWAINKDGACKSNHSERVNVTRNDNNSGSLYRCSCSKGYFGNPYIDGGCQDIDECKPPEKNPCGSGTKCRNVQGDYKCKCKFGHVRIPIDPQNDKGDCQPIIPGYATAIVVTVVCSFVLVLLLCLLRREQRRRREEHRRRVRRGCFDKNGGKILEGMNMKTFTQVELEEMTNHYSKPIGTGYFGKVFEGTIITDSESQRVAVKCPKPDTSQQKQQNKGGEFVDEIVFQFKVSHENLVRLIGCCLETNVPCLVFEFVSNGSLYDVLHGAAQGKVSLPLTKRLDIAIGSAEAVSYMHSHGEHKHVHGDIKPANILLDDDLMPKVSDFGSAKLLSIDMYTKAVAADRSYVDPVYMKTDRFTAKSDVYSFGVVLLELITRKTAKYDDNSSLPIDFVKCFKEDGNGRKMYDKDIFMKNHNNGDDVQSSQVCMGCLDKIGGLAVRCLNEVDIDERPTMAEVVEELKKAKEVVDNRGSSSNM